MDLEVAIQTITAEYVVPDGETADPSEVQAHGYQPVSTRPPESRCPNGHDNGGIELTFPLSANGPFGDLLPLRVELG